MHLDLSANNILFDEPLCPLIADFNMSCLISSPPTSPAVGTLGFKAPETSVEPPIYTCAADIFALGKIFGQMKNLPPMLAAACTVETPAKRPTIQTVCNNLANSAA